MIGKIHALSGAALLPTSDHEDLSRFPNRLNNRIRHLKNNFNRDAWSSEVQELLEKVIGAMERHLSKLSATDCSRLAWLYLNIGNSQRAMDMLRSEVNVIRQTNIVKISFIDYRMNDSRVSPPFLASARQ